MRMRTEYHLVPIEYNDKRDDDKSLHEIVTTRVRNRYRWHHLFHILTSTEYHIIFISIFLFRTVYIKVSSFLVSPAVVQDD